MVAGKRTRREERIMSEELLFLLGVIVAIFLLLFVLFKSERLLFQIVILLLTIFIVLACSDPLVQKVENVCQVISVTDIKTNEIVEIYGRHVKQNGDSSISYRDPFGNLQEFHPFNMLVSFTKVDDSFCTPEKQTELKKQKSNKNESSKKDPQTINIENSTINFESVEINTKEND